MSYDNSHDDTSQQQGRYTLTEDTWSTASPHGHGHGPPPLTPTPQQRHQEDSVEGQSAPLEHTRAYQQASSTRSSRVTDRHHHGSYGFGGVEGDVYQQEQETDGSSQSHYSPPDDIHDNNGTGSGRHPNLDYPDHGRLHHDSVDQLGSTLGRVHQDALGYNYDSWLTRSRSPLSFTSHDASPPPPVRPFLPRQPHLSSRSYSLLPLRTSTTFESPATSSACGTNSSSFSRVHARDRLPSSLSLNGRSITSLSVPGSSSPYSHLESAQDVTVPTSHWPSGTPLPGRARRSNPFYTTSIHPFETSPPPPMDSNYSEQGHFLASMSSSGGNPPEGNTTTVRGSGHFGSTDREGYERRGELLRSFSHSGEPSEQTNVGYPSSFQSSGPSRPTSSAERLEHVNIEISSPLGTRSRTHDPDDTYGAGDHRHLDKTKEAESDVERYTDLMRKSGTQVSLADQKSLGNKHDRHRRFASCSSDLERGESSKVAQHHHHHHHPPYSKVVRVHSNNEDHSSEKATEVPLQASGSPAQTIFSFSSIKSNILSRLFGSQHSSSDRSGLFHTHSSLTPTSRSQGNDGDQGVADKGKAVGSPSSMGPPVARIPSIQTPDHENQAEGLARNFTTNRTPLARSGGILSNLLKLQALSMPTPSQHHRRRRRHRQHAHHRRKNPRKSSVASDTTPSRSPRHMLASPNASVLSLPGLLMTAPSGIGLNPNAASSSTTVCSPEPSTFLNSRSDHGQSVSTAGRRSSEGFRLPSHRHPIMSSMTPKDATLSPDSLGERGRVESPRYLQTHAPYSTRSSISGDDATSMCSSVSQDPVVTAMRLNQQAELTEAVADILVRQDLLIRLCKSLIRYGAPSHRIEFAMETMCRRFEIDGSFAFLPGLMMISFGDSDTHTSETHLIKCAQGFDMGRLAKVHKIARAIVNEGLEPREALTRLKAVNNEKPLYSMWVVVASYIGNSAFICPLIFKGSWYDMLASMGLGAVVGVTTVLASRFSIYSSVFEVSTSILIAFVAKALRSYVCFTGVVLSAIVVLLPGLSLTTAIMELSSRYMISGSVRMFYSLIYCLFLGFGLSIGSNLWDVFQEPLQGDLRKGGYCHPVTEPWRWVLFPLLGLSVGVQMYASPRQWPAMIVCSSVGYAISELAGVYWPHAPHIAAAVSAFVAGLLGNIYERITHELAFVPILGSILLIVPGGMGVRSTLLLLDQSANASQGTAFALQMILIALGIAVGLFAATLVVYPLGKRRNALLTF